MLNSLIKHYGKKQVALAVFKLLSETQYCIIQPHMINNYSKYSLLFPPFIEEEFLNFVLDCLECLTNKPEEFSQTSEKNQNTGYSLLVEDKPLINEILNLDITSTVVKEVKDYLNTGSIL